jgi:hypothetical protein
MVSVCRILKAKALIYLYSAWIWTAAALLMILMGFTPAIITAQEKAGEPESTSIQNPKLVQGTICEKIENQRPINAGLVFSVAARKIHCLTTFDQIIQTQFITHRWYYRDDPVATFRLALQPPRWSTFSSLQIREMDRGPWRVEIRDAQGQLIQGLRFSVSD